MEEAVKAEAEMEEATEAEKAQVPPIPPEPQPWWMSWSPRCGSTWSWPHSCGGTTGTGGTCESGGGHPWHKTVSLLTAACAACCGVHCSEVCRGLAL